MTAPDLTPNVTKLSVLEMPHRIALHVYWQRLIPLVGETWATHICEVAADAIRQHPGVQRVLGRVQAHWYDSVAQGAPDYGVYRAPIYLAEVWYCWSTYSRMYLRQLAKLGVLNDVTSIADLGCGTGYSTAALRQIAPHASVIGTNVLEGTQGRFCKSMADEYGFALRAGPQEVGAVQAVFASEYFEHFPAPLEHLQEVLAACQPRKLIIANTFTSPSIGHFPTYAVNGQQVDGARASRAFNASLTQAGYRQLKLKLWNNRPAVWELQ